MSASTTYVRCGQSLRTSILFRRMTDSELIIICFLYSKMKRVTADHDHNACRRSLQSVCRPYELYVRFPMITLFSFVRPGDDNPERSMKARGQRAHPSHSMVDCGLLAGLNHETISLRTVLNAVLLCMVFCDYNGDAHFLTFP